MQGRNGVDHLARFINIVGLAFLLTAILFTFVSVAFDRHALSTPALVFRILHYVFYGIGVLMLAYWLFRTFSRNVAKRQAENTRFLYFRQKIRRKTESAKQQWRDRKTYRYFNCPKCKQRMRAPRHKGKIRVTCRNCGNIFETKT
jgi:hypothetical protein